MRLVVTKMNLGLWAAAYVKEKINAAQPTVQKPFVLGLPTGGTVIDFYANLRLFYKEQTLDFQPIITFNMDEYMGLPSDHPQSYHSYMKRHLFNEVNIQAKNIHILNGQAENTAQECMQYEEAIRACGGIDLLLGGVGENGHIAFNEPGSALNSRTRQVHLTPETLQANARFFFNNIHRVPPHALTIGIGTILDARELLFLAAGRSKAKAVARLCQPGITPQCPLTALKLHPHATLLADLEAFSQVEATPKELLQTAMQTNPAAPHWVLKLTEEIA